MVKSIKRGGGRAGIRNQGRRRLAFSRPVRNQFGLIKNKMLTHGERRKARLIEQLGTIYISNISEGTAFLLQGVYTKKHGAPSGPWKREN